MFYLLGPTHITILFLAIFNFFITIIRPFRLENDIFFITIFALITIPIILFKTCPPIKFRDYISSLKYINKNKLNKNINKKLVIFSFSLMVAISAVTSQFYTGNSWINPSFYINFENRYMLWQSNLRELIETTSSLQRAIPSLLVTFLILLTIYFNKYLIDRSRYLLAIMFLIPLIMYSISRGSFFHIFLSFFTFFNFYLKQNPLIISVGFFKKGKIKIKYFKILGIAFILIIVSFIIYLFLMNHLSRDPVNKAYFDQIIIENIQLRRDVYSNILDGPFNPQIMYCFFVVSIYFTFPFIQAVRYIYALLKSLDIFRLILPFNLLNTNDQLRWSDLLENYISNSGILGVTPHISLTAELFYLLGIPITILFFFIVIKHLYYFELKTFKCKSFSLNNLSFLVLQLFLISMFANNILSYSSIKLLFIFGFVYSFNIYLKKRLII